MGWRCSVLTLPVLIEFKFVFVAMWGINYSPHPARPSSQTKRCDPFAALSVVLCVLFQLHSLVPQRLTFTPGTPYATSTGGNYPHSRLIPLVSSIWTATPDLVNSSRINSYPFCITPWKSTTLSCSLALYLVNIIIKEIYFPSVSEIYHRTKLNI